MNRLSLLPLLALAVAPCLAQDPATNAPAFTARLASVDAVEFAIQGVLAAVGRPGMPPEASPRHWLAELCDVDPARPVVIRLWTGADGEPEGVVAVPGAEPTAERLAEAFDGETPVRGADGVWTKPDDDGTGQAVAFRDGYVLVAKPRRYLAEADALFAVKPRFPGAAAEAEIRPRAIADRNLRTGRELDPDGIMERMFEGFETLSFGLAFDKSAGLLVPFSMTPPASDSAAFKDFAAAPALDPATALWSGDATVSFAVSDFGRVFGGLLDFYADTLGFVLSDFERILRESGADEATIEKERKTTLVLPEMFRRCKAFRAASGFGSLSSSGGFAAIGDYDLGDPATAAWMRDYQRLSFEIQAAAAATNCFSFRETSDGWEWGFDPAATFAAIPSAFPIPSSELLRRFYGRDEIRGSARLLPGTKSSYRFVAAPVGAEPPAPARDPIPASALARFAPGAKSLSCFRMRLSDIVRETLLASGAAPEGAVPPGGALRFDLAAKDGLPVGLLAVEPAEMNALFVSFMFGVTHAMAPAAPAPSGEAALFDD